MSNARLVLALEGLEVRLEMYCGEASRDLGKLTFVMHGECFAR